MSESVPYRTALAQGATHLLVLRSRRDPLTWPDGRVPARSLRLISRTTLRRESAALRATFLGRDARLAAADRQLADYESAPDGQPAVLSIRPPASSPEVSRLATDGKLLLAAFEAGRVAARTALNGPSDQGSHDHP